MYIIVWRTLLLGILIIKFIKDQTIKIIERKKTEVTTYSSLRIIRKRPQKKLWSFFVYIKFVSYICINNQTI
jgi:hypothetical protein